MRHLVIYQCTPLHFTNKSLTALLQHTLCLGYKINRCLENVRNTLAEPGDVHL
jgi:hypothetical protein